MLNTLAQDLRYGARIRLRNPGLTLIAVLTLALGIGLNSAMFSLVNAVLLRPLPFDDPDRLVFLQETRRNEQQGSIGGHEFVAWRDRNHAFERMALFGYTAFTLTGRAEPRVLQAMVTTADYFRVLGSQALHGRDFAAGEDQGRHRVAVVSQRLWQQQFGQDSALVGRTIRLNDEAYAVIGVMPARGDFDPDLWVPLDLAEEVLRVGRHSFFAVARLKPQVTIDQAARELNAIAVQLEREYRGFNEGHRVAVRSLYDNVVQGTRRPMWVLLGAVGFVLLIACANVAHLLLTSALGRVRELAVRTALGASRRRLISQLVTEGLLLGLAGAALGLLLAVWLTEALSGIDAIDIPRLADVRIDSAVLVVTAALGVLAGVLSSVVPALRGSRLQLSEWLSTGTRAHGAPGGRLSSVMMVSQVALALMLLIGAGLMVRSFGRLAAVDPGFESDRAVVMQFALPPARFASPDRQADAVNRLVSAIAAHPDVQAVGTTTALPLTVCCNNYVVSIEGRPAPAPGEELHGVLDIVSPDYFRAMGIPLRQGRTFTTADARIALPLIRYWEQQPLPVGFDRPQPAPVAVINEAMARQYWPNEDPIGKRFRILFSPAVTIVGVVANVRRIGLNAEYEPEMYLAQTQEPRGALSLVVRTRSRDPLAIVPAVRAQLRALDPDIPLEQVRTLDRLVDASVGRPRFLAVLLATFGMLALLLSCLGIYGVISYAVAQRIPEIGIRTALGASAGNVMRLVLGHALALTCIGCVLGLASALALTRSLSALLFGIEPTDPLTFGVITAVLIGAALLASYLPTRRAVRIDPMVSLRHT